MAAAVLLFPMRASLGGLSCGDSVNSSMRGDSELLGGCPFDSDVAFSIRRRPQLFSKLFNANATDGLRERLVGPFMQIEAWDEPHVGLKGDDGADPAPEYTGPTGRLLRAPGRVLEAVAAARVSAVLRVEVLAPPQAADAMDALGSMYGGFDPAGGDTAHVYVGGPGLAALNNHTDVYDIIVVQLSGRKRWRLCSDWGAQTSSDADAESPQPPPQQTQSDKARLDAPAALPREESAWASNPVDAAPRSSAIVPFGEADRGFPSQKLDLCAVYSDQELSQLPVGWRCEEVRTLPYPTKRRHARISDLLEC